MISIFGIVVIIVLCDLCSPFSAGFSTREKNEVGFFVANERTIDMTKNNVLRAFNRTRLCSLEHLFSSALMYSLIVDRQNCHLSKMSVFLINNFCAVKKLA